MKKGVETFKRHYSSKEEFENFDRDADHGEDNLHEHYTLIARSGQKPVRVDKFLANLLPFTTRSRIKNASRTGSISVNDQEVKVSYKVKPGDTVKLMLPYPPNPKLEPENIPLDIRFEDDSFIILHKPPNMVCHPSFGHRTGTLVHGLIFYFKNLPVSPKEKEHTRPGLVHRLDRDTSGIMVIAKEEYAMAHLSKQFFDRTSDRTYQALVWGDVKEDEGRIEAHIGRHPKQRKLWFAFPDGSEGKHAVTHYKVLERFGIATWVECKLETGRTHQIRVHMKYLGHTLFMDKEYGGDKILKGPQTKKYQQFIRNCFEILPRQGLHAKTLSIDHPYKKERMHFESELPEDMQGVINKLRSWSQHSTF
ncbi:MAG: RluA family pseudouridine synthase [Bacteroidota bacterium]